MGLILTDTLKLLRHGFGQFAMIFLAIQAPLQIVQLIALPGSDQPQGELGNTGNLMLSAIFFGFLGLFATLNVMMAARFRVGGSPKVFYEVFLHSIIKFPTAVFATIILFITVFAGLLVLIIPGIIFFIFGCCFLQAIAVTDRRIISSLIESYDMVRGNWWNVFLFQIVLVMVVGIVGLPLFLFDYLVAPPLAIKVPLYLIFDAVGIVANVASVLMFYNLLAIRAHRIMGA